MNNIYLTIIMGLLAVIVFLFRNHRNLKQSFTEIKRERDDLVIGFERIKQNAKKYQVIKKEAFNGDIDLILERMRKRGQVDDA